MPAEQPRSSADSPPASFPEPPPEFHERVRTLGIEFEPGDLERLGRFLALLLEANKTTNLTAITDPAQAWMKHILDALTIVPVLASLRNSDGLTELQNDAGQESAPANASSLRHSAAPSLLSVIDIGSGGGLPAMPLAIVLPDVKFTLVEATGKKADFLDRAIAELGLSNARVFQARAEAIGQEHKIHREKYDAAIARALGHLAIVAELCGPLVRPHGVVIAVKGAKADQELRESEKALGMIGLRHLQTAETPTGRLVLLEKTTRTPRLYPRRDGEPSRVPLGLVRKK